MGQQLQRNPNSNADELLLMVTKMMKNQFGLKPKGLTFLYKRSYPEWYDLIALPQITGSQSLLSSLAKAAQAQ